MISEEGMTNGCEQCEKHDIETRRLMTEAMGKDERSFITILLCNQIKQRHVAMARIPSQVVTKQDARISKACIQRDIDFASAVLSKFVVSFTTEEWATMEGILQKNGLDMNVNHERCPHKENK